MMPGSPFRSPTLALPKWANNLPRTSTFAPSTPAMFRHGHAQRRFTRYLLTILGLYCLIRLFSYTFSGPPRPRIQSATFHRSVDYTQTHRQAAVKKEFLHAWTSYRDHSWMADGLLPLSGGRKTQFCSWSATLIDSLDTLWIMDLHEEFEEAVNATMTVDFRHSAGMCEVSLFESTIRYLGGLLGAYDLSGEERLLGKVKEVGEVLSRAFDTSNGMPCSFCHLVGGENEDGVKEVFVPSQHVAMADVGSLYLEFGRLGQLTGERGHQRVLDRLLGVFERTMNDSTVPGLWPEMVDSSSIEDAEDGTLARFARASSKYSLGALSDSSYEYLVKGHMMMGAVNSTYGRMWEMASEQIRQLMLFRAFIPDAPAQGKKILFSGVINKEAFQETVELEPRMQHLACFAGGMFAMASRIFGNGGDFEIGRQLTEGCVWAYDHSPTGLMPETFSLSACPDLNEEQCEWNLTAWDNYRQGCTADGSCTTQEMPLGWVSVGDPKYILRPEAIESIFVMWRMTGDEYWRAVGWRMFQTIIHHTRTPFGHSAIFSVLYQSEMQVIEQGVPTTSMKAMQQDDMESFWFAETLKYFYLLFSDVKLIDLDEFVLNTEAHPLRLTDDLRGF
jgi:mannosyl-oligosaccharide alpha-1,2-mannosidase